MIPLLWLGLGGSPASAQDEPPAPASGVLTRPPELIAFVEAEFPASEAGRTGSVTLAVTIREDGTVEDAAVVESAGAAFDAAAVAAVLGFRFTPAEVDGAPSRIRILYRYDFVETLELPTTAVFAGVVRDRERKVPLPGVTVTLGNGRSAVTDAEGRFELRDVAPGAMTVSLEGDRLTALSTEETFVAGERLDATYDVFLADPDEVADDLEILVTAPSIRRAAVSTELGAEEARKVPGTQGDVLRVVENLPGVARASLGTGALIVWGAAPEDTGVYVDGVRVPRLYHDGGLRSVVGSEFVRSVELVPGGYGAAYGRGLGGLVAVTTARFDEREGVHGALSADLYDGAGALYGRVGERVTFGVGARASWVGELLEQVAPGVGEVFPLPRYTDGQARVGVRLGPHEAIDVTALGSTDRTARSAPSADPARQASEERALAFHRVMARWSRDDGSGAVSSATVYVGTDRPSLEARFGPVVTEVRSTTDVFGLRASHRERVAEPLTVETGVDAEFRVTDVSRRGSLAAPAREGDRRAFGQPPPDQVAADDWRVGELGLAPYAELDLSDARQRVGLVAGLRADPYVRSVSRALPKVGGSPTRGLFQQGLELEPRVALRASPDERVTFTAAAGRYGQGPSPSDLSATFGNPALPTASAVHGVLAAAVRPVDGVSIEVTGFATRSRDLAARNPSEQPSRAQGVLPIGRGRTRGAQVMARAKLDGGPYGWISYTLAWAERRDTPLGPWRPSDYDQRHVLTALGGLELPLGVELSVRGRVATGYPRTEVIGGVYDARRDLVQPVLSGHNGVRLPTFFQADVQVARAFAIGATELEVRLEVQNATDQVNVEEYVYAPDWSERGGIQGLPVLPVLGLRWTF